MNWRADGEQMKKKKTGETKKLFFALFPQSERLEQATLILTFSLLGVRGF